MENISILTSATIFYYPNGISIFALFLVTQFFFNRFHLFYYRKKNRYICNVKSELKKEKRENTLDVKSILIYVHPVIPRRESGSKFRSHNL